LAEYKYIKKRVARKSRGAVVDSAMAENIIWTKPRSYREWRGVEDY